MVKLSDGREITFNFYAITIKEYRSLFSNEQEQEEEDALVARVAGMTVDELTGLPQPDYRRLLRGFLREAANSDDEKN